MIRALALSLMLLCGSAHAGGAACFPQSPWVPINLSGKGLMEGADARLGGTWSAIWCPTGTFSPTTGTEVWSLYTHAVLDKYRTVNADALIDMAQAIIAAPDPLAALNAAIKSRELIPPVGSIDRFNWESLLFAACTEGVRLAPFPGQPITRPCTPPTPITVETWRASGGTIFTAASGRLTGLTTRKAAVGAKCNNTVSQIVVKGSVYLPLDGGPLTEVTLCAKATS